MTTLLVLLKCDPRTGGWVREDRLVFEDDETASGEQKARAQGEAWISESSDQRREYRVLPAKVPVDWEGR